MTWTFVATPKVTSVTVVADDVPPGISQADQEAGMNSTLENLASYVE